MFSWLACYQAKSGQNYLPSDWSIVSDTELSLVDNGSSKSVATVTPLKCYNRNALQFYMIPSD